jgi:hypothetical protein
LSKRQALICAIAVHGDRDAQIGTVQEQMVEGILYHLLLAFI